VQKGIIGTRRQPEINPSTEFSDNAFIKEILPARDIYKPLQHTRSDK